VETNPGGERRVEFGGRRAEAQDLSNPDQTCVPGVATIKAGFPLKSWISTAAAFAGQNRACAGEGMRFVIWKRFIFAF
jgi:hypothetical protein